MSIYLLVFLLLAAGTLLEYFRPQIKTYAYWICWAAMTGCLCFRFGQGTDYVTYQGLYETIPAAIDLSGICLWILSGNRMETLICSI